MFKADVLGEPSIQEVKGVVRGLFFYGEDGSRSRARTKTHQWFETRVEAKAYMMDYYTRNLARAKEKVEFLSGALETTRGL